MRKSWAPFCYYCFGLLWYKIILTGIALLPWNVAIAPLVASSGVMLFVGIFTLRELLYWEWYPREPRTEYYLLATGVAGLLGILAFGGLVLPFHKFVYD
jgi:hypothetical protein